MAIQIHHLFLLLLTFTLTTTLSAAGRHLSAAPFPQPTKPNATLDFLTSHNQPRAAVGVPPLSWSPSLAAAASRYARYQRDSKACAFADLSASTYGANQAWASYKIGPADVVAAWVAAGKYYNAVNNTCAAGQECGTYTQVVWRKTMEVGCSQTYCAKAGTTTTTLTICLYNPHGNVVGERPY